MIATLDYLIACCLWAGIADARKQTKYFHQSVAFYKYHDGKDGRRNWSTELFACLHAWQKKFPQVVRKRKSMLDPPAPAAGDGQGAEPIPQKWLL